MKKIIFASVLISLLIGFSVCANAIMQGRAYVAELEADKAQKYQDFIMRMAMKDAGQQNYGVTKPTSITIYPDKQHLEEYRRSIK